jgi:hypothetical protein
MGFVNEYVPEADIEKYGLRGIWDKYYPLYKGEFFLGNKPHWTIDRSKNTFLMSIGIGRGEHGNRRKFLLWLNGTHVVIEVDLLKGSSGNLDASPFILIWGLARMKLPETLGEKEEEMIQTFKKALTTFGYWGITDQRPNTTVEFKF